MSFQPLENGIPDAPQLESVDQTTYFSCSVCSKIFTKRLSRNRHVLYCRQKQLKQNHSRKKSCTICRRAKTRCSETIPQCMRCKAKRLECNYDGEYQAASALHLLVGADPTASEVELATLPAQARRMPLLNPDHEGNSEGDFWLNNLTPSHDYLLGPIDREMNFDWGLQVPQIEGQDDCFSTHRLDQMVQDMCNSAHQLTFASCPEGSSQITGQLEYDLQSPRELPQYSPYLDTVNADMSLLSARAARFESISSTAEKRGLFRRREKSFGSQLSGYYLLQTLRSYPRMILSSTLPAFIHEKCGSLGARGLVVGSIESSDLLLPEPLANCKSIMSLYFSETAGSTSFVWKIIDMELDRLGTEFQAFDECSLMSALQALTIYILLATLEEDNLSPSIDAKMLHVMMAVAAKIEEPNYMYDIAQYGEWQEWILQESRDRTFTLLFIINMLFDINPSHDANTCNAISVMPVPAHKSLWQATCYPNWKKAHTDFLQKREGRPNLTYRDMVQLSQKSQASQKHTLDDLDDWFLNLDTFGTFVLMTATSV